jgi:RNA polymerase sigma factor (sigma-70 family)
MATQVLNPVQVNTPARALPGVKPPSDRVINALPIEDQVLLTKLLTEPTEFVDHPDFADSSVERKLFGGPAKTVARTSTRFIEQPDPITDAVAAGERVPALSYEQEGHLFERFNYARREAARILASFAGKKLSVAATRRVLRWGHRVLRTRGVIVRLNMPLVLAMAKRTRLTNIDFNEMISEGNMALLRSVEKFDCSRGYKFSTYSCRAILKAFSRVAMRASRYRGQFPTEFDPAMERSDYIEKRRKGVEEDCVDELKEIMVRNVANLSEVEHVVIRERFALGLPVDGEMPSPKTLEQVGHIIGVTKERVRQIQNNALKKIRGALEDKYLAA